MNKLRDLREDRDLTQEDVAKLIGIDQRTLSNYENGRTNPDSFVIVKLADFYGVSADYLIGRETAHTTQISLIQDKLAKIQKELSDVLEEIKKLSAE